MELKKCKLSDLCVSTEIGIYGIPAPAEAYSTEKVRYLRISDISDDGNLLDNDKKSVSDDEIEKYYLKEDDIVFARTGNSTGRAYLYNPQDGALAFAGFLIKYGLDKNKINPLYMKYFTISNYYKQWVKNLSNGSTRGNISAQTFADCPIIFPEKDQQDFLATVLSTLDRKISLNRSINEELERMAKEVYDYWFVQFDFPDEHGRPYKSSGGAMVYNPVLKREVPQGWEVKNVKNVVTHINTGLNPRDNFKLGDGDIKYITVKNLTLEGNIDFTSCDTIDEEALAKVHNRSNIQKGDILFASISPLGRCFYIDQEPTGWDINESVFAIRPNADEISGKYLYLFLKSQEFVKKAEKSATGSIFLGIRMETLKKIDILLPANDVLKEFDKVLNNIIGKQHQNFDENERLTKLRDELLPLLMTGQVKVK